jgi:uncharacterized protein
MTDKYQEWSSEREIFVPMRDGVHLSTTVVRPKDATGTLAAILVRSPYDDTSLRFRARRVDPCLCSSHWLWLDYFIRQGYAVVLQDERGRGFSEGYYKEYLEGANTDGYDTIDWIVKQPWSNGKVGAIGCSSTGETQWLAAAGNPPGFAAMIPGSTWAVGNVPGNETQGAFYRGGVPRAAFWAWWYSWSGPSERLLLPPHSTQEQRIRLRNSYSLQWLFAKDFFAHSGTIDSSGFMHLPSKDIVRQFGGALTPFDNYITWTPADRRWNEVSLINAGIKPRVPALHVSTWHDGAAVEVIRLFKYLQDLGTPNQYLIMGPGPHCAYFSEDKFADFKFGDLDIGDARYAGEDHGYKKLFLNWFEYWLNGKQNNVTNMRKVQLYVMGKGWISGDQWPLKGTHLTKYYLSSGPVSRLLQNLRVLSTSVPEIDEKDGYVYDPSVPVPTSVGSNGSIMGAFDPLDQRPVEARKDVLVYATPPLDKSVTIVGHIDIVLYVSSSAKDTDFMATLIDVYPDGKAINLDDDAFRVRYREGFDKKILMQPGNVYKINLSNMITAIRFPKGHRIGIHISSSNFPKYERNLNTGGNNYDETTWMLAENNVHHGPRYPSHVALPVLPD